MLELLVLLTAAQTTFQHKMEYGLIQNIQMDIPKSKQKEPLLVRVEASKKNSVSGGGLLQMLG